jgi:hypothetical protein
LVKFRRKLNCNHANKKFISVKRKYGGRTKIIRTFQSLRIFCRQS